MESKKSSLSLRERFEICGGQVGSQFGGGTASGAGAFALWIARGGWMTVFTVILSTIIAFTVYTLSLETARVCKVDNYNSLYRKVYGKYEKQLSWLADIVMVIAMFTGIAISFSGMGSVFKQTLGADINSYLVCSIMAIVCILLVAFGLEGFRKTTSFMAIVISSMCVVMFGLALINGGIAGIINNIRTGWMPESASIPNMLYSIVIGGIASNAYISIFLTSSKGKLKSRADVFSTMRLGFVLNLIAVALPALTVLGFCPGIIGQPIFTLAIIEGVMPGIAVWLYTILLLFAFVSTAVGSMPVLADRFEKYLPKSISEGKRKLIIYVVLMILGIFSSDLGINNVIYFTSSYMPLLSFFVIVLPMLINGPRLIARGSKE